MTVKRKAEKNNTELEDDSWNGETVFFFFFFFSLSINRSNARKKIVLVYAFGVRPFHRLVKKYEEEEKKKNKSNQMVDVFSDAVIKIGKIESSAGLVLVEENTRDWQAYSIFATIVVINCVY